MSFAVAMTKTLSFFSCSHAKNVPNTRWLVPPSWSPWPSAFSISSSHSTTGAMLSAVLMARFRLRSDSPKYF